MTDFSRTDELLVVRSLKESDLGLFAAHRKTQKGRQRAINLNSTVVSQLFSEEIIKAEQVTPSIRIRMGDFENEGHRLIKRTQKNWRLGGNKLEDKIFSEIDAGDFMLLRSPRNNDGTKLISISFVARKLDGVVHAGISSIVERRISGSMAVFHEGDPHFRNLARYCSIPESDPEIEPIPEPDDHEQVKKPPTVSQKVRSPSIMGRMFQLAGDLSAPAQLRFVETVEELASQMRILLEETGGIVRLQTSHREFWPKVRGKALGFVDGGLANLSATGAAPIAARVGGYVVTPGADHDDREDFVMLQELIDDLFSHREGGVYDSLFPDYGALRDAARISIEAAGAVRLLERRSDLATVMLHGALVNPVSRYSDLMTDGEVRCAFPDFSSTALNHFLPCDDPQRNGKHRQFISVYLRQLQLLRGSEAVVCGVVEREGTTSTVSSALLDGFREEEIAHLLPVPFEEWRNWYRRALRPENDDEMEGQRITDSLLFRCVLREGEALAPVVVDRNEIRRAPRAWTTTISQFPKPCVSFVQVSEWNAPVRLEMFTDAAKPFQRTAELLYHSSRLLPKYAFPAGLDIVDKFAKIPNWMSRPANTRATVRALSMALESGDTATFNSLRRLLVGTGREWITRPNIMN